MLTINLGLGVVGLGLLIYSLLSLGFSEGLRQGLNFKSSYKANVGMDYEIKVEKLKKVKSWYWISITIFAIGLILTLCFIKELTIR